MLAHCLLALALAAARTPTPGGAPGTGAPSIDWPQFFAAVSTRGVSFSERLTALEGKRVRLRGYSVRHPGVAGGLLLTKAPYSDPHGVEETDVPYDVVGVVWRRGFALPRVPARPTIEGTLRLGNRTLSGQVVTILLEDAIPVLPNR